MNQIRAMSALRIGVILWASSAAYAVQETGLSTKTYPVHVELGGRKFEVARNYFWYLRKASTDGDRGLNLHAALPEFSPLTTANINIFTTPGSERKLIILVGEHNMNGRANSLPMDRATVLNRISSGLPDTARAREGVPADLRPIVPRQSADDLFVGTTGFGELYWVRCGKLGSVKFPSCSSTFAYSNHVYVRYTFDRRLVQQWREIDVGVNALIRKFEQIK